MDGLLLGNKKKNLRVALVLPNGPELACAILATSTFAGCVPLSATGAVSELKQDILRCGPDLVIGPYAASTLPHIDWTVHAHVAQVATECNIPYCGLIPHPEIAGPFRLVSGTTVVESFAAAPVAPPVSAPSLPCNTGLDEALVLFTSGTTGNKKLVPHVTCDLLCAAVTIALSWELDTSDTNCNLMPLFHVGGICRQVFAPGCSGSAVICCPAFDAHTFWNLLQAGRFNWYYAAPTMHQIILQTGEQVLGRAIIP